jgi:Ser/Thr protein kinase RdoA (MazF antagonist)
VRLSTPGEHFVLRIAPEAHLLREVFFGRTMAAHNLPAASLMYYDLKRTLVPFDYTVERHVCGSSAHHIATEAPHLLHSAARQAGRTLARMHRVRVEGWGHPAVSGRWLVPDWRSLLTDLHTRLAPLTLAAPVFGPTEQRLAAAALRHPALTNEVQPCLLHGALGPHTVRCTVGEHVQLEALVDPGPLVAGDSMLDLARALDPASPAAWREGLLDGYRAVRPLSATEHERLSLLRLLACYWQTCQRYARAEPHAVTLAHTQVLLEQQHALLEPLLSVEEADEDAPDTAH